MSRDQRAATPMNVSPLKHLSAWLPIAMSVAALAVVLAHVAVFGTAREPDEGTSAHVFQVLLAAQLPIALFFAFRWLPRAPTQALTVLAVQAAAALVALAPVYFLGL